MTDGSEVQQVTSIQELAELLELQSVAVLELHATALEQIDESRPPEFRIGTVDSLQQQLQHVRFRLEVGTPDADYVAVVAVTHTSQAELSIAREAWRDYIEQVSFMIAFPYMREAVAGLAARLTRVVPTLPVMKRGQFTLAPEGPATDAEEPEPQD